jgi:hypothetical protein
VSGAHVGPVTNFSSAMKFPVDSCGFVIYMSKEILNPVLKGKKVVIT